MKKKEHGDIVRALLNSHLRSAWRDASEALRLKLPGKDPVYIEARKKLRDSQNILDAYDGKHYEKVLIELDHAVHDLIEEIDTVEEVRKMGGIPEETAEEMKDRLYRERNEIERCRRRLLELKLMAKRSRKKH